MTQRNVWRVLWLCSSVMLATGCAPYVNIPPQAGDVAMHDANLGTVQEVSVAALKAFLEDRPTNGPFTLVLPRGTTAASYQRVTQQLGEDATTEVNVERPIVEVRQLRIRADRAEVDIVSPANYYEPRGTGQLVTIYMNWKPFTGWHVYRTHRWNSPTQIEEPAADYATAPVTPAVEDVPEDDVNVDDELEVLEEAADDAE